MTGPPTVWSQRQSLAQKRPQRSRGFSSMEPCLGHSTAVRPDQPLGAHVLGTGGTLATERARTHSHPSAHSPSTSSNRLLAW